MVNVKFTKYQKHIFTSTQTSHFGKIDIIQKNDLTSEIRELTEIGIGGDHIFVGTILGPMEMTIKKIIGSCYVCKVTHLFSPADLWLECDKQVVKLIHLCTTATTFCL